MNFLLIADTHFGDSIMYEYQKRAVGFEDIILKNIKYRGNKSDVLIHLGDFCIGNDKCWHRKYMLASTGRNWLIRGNHDSKSNSWYLTNGWDFVGESITLNMYGIPILFTHKPKLVPEGIVNIHGHLHNTEHHDDKRNGRNVLVRIEHMYQSINLQQVIQKYNMRSSGEF